jgi:hypothetical protein
MSDTQKIQWKRLSVEAAAIVTSILLAFSIDAWWENRLERIEELRILDTLRAEFLSNIESIPSYIERHQISADYTKELLDLMRAAEPGSTLRYAAAKLARVLAHSTTNPHSGALDAILQSGELRYISNPAIRERLAAWPRLVVDATENEDLLITLWGPKLIGALANVVDLSNLPERAGPCWEYPPPEQCAAIEISLPRDTEVMAYLVQTGDYALEGARELSLLVEEANEIVLLINQELATP